MTTIDDDSTRSSAIPRRTDVLVVGAGPTGLSFACGLAQRGIDHVVIDHAPRAAAYSQSTMLDARTLQALEMIDASDPLVRRGFKAAQFVLRDGDHELMSVDFSALPTRYPYALMLPESTAASVLSERLTAYGSSVLRPVTAVGLEQDADGVTVQLWDGSTSRSGGPARQSILARYVVGCDGMHSQIRSALEIPFVGSSRSESFVMADVRMHWPLPRSEVHLFFSDSGLLLVAPLPDERYRILAPLHLASGVAGLGVLQDLLATRGPRTSPARVQELVWSTSLRVDGRLATHYRSGRVFLAGDAAHVHSPAGGQGMNSGIQDALYLAEKLADVLVGRADGAVLSRYEEERRAVAESIMQLTRRMSGAASLRGQRGPRLRNRILRVVGRVPAIRLALAHRLSGLAWTTRSRRSADESPFLYAVTLGLIALLVGTSFAQTLETHALFAYVVDLIQGAAVVATSWLAARRKREGRGFAISAIAATCLFAAFGIWVILIRPTHANIASFDGDAVSHGQAAAQAHSALAYWGRVALQLCSFVLLASPRR